MGLFDSWRRKRKPVVTTKPHKPERVIVPDTEVSKEVKDEDLSALLAEYEELVKRKEALQVERNELNAKLERGEIEPTAFRKELMNRIQEAASVSESIRVTGAKLVSLGYRGIL